MWLLGNLPALVTTGALQLSPAAYLSPHIGPFGPLHSMVPAILADLHCPFVPTVVIQQRLACHSSGNCWLHETFFPKSCMMTFSRDQGNMASCGPLEEKGLKHLVSSRSKKMVKVSQGGRGLGAHSDESIYGWDWIGGLPVKLWLCITLLGVSPGWERDGMKKYLGGIEGETFPYFGRSQILEMVYIGVGSCLICLTTATGNVKIAIGKKCSHTTS